MSLVRGDKFDPWGTDGDHYCATLEGDGESIFILTSPPIDEAHMAIFIVKDKPAARILAGKLRQLAITFEKLIEND